MCGIWARTHFDDSVKMEELIYPIQSLSHRGPDGYAWWLQDQVALVHTRLSIIDLAGGAQPLESYDKQWVGIVNGELYDYEEIRSKLQKDGIAFQTQSDSEVLLNLYVSQGAKGLAQVSGEFAFIFYNKSKNELHFGRDPFGVKPLFYEHEKNMFTLASEMKALKNAKPEFSETYVKTFLARAIIPPDTALKNVFHVWPGRIYTLNVKTQQMNWEIYQPVPLLQTRNLQKDEAIEALDFELKGAVKRRLRADVEVGCYLSGGIDSALVVALAAHQGAKPQTFTVGFADRDFDESTQAAQIANDFGLRHSSVILTSKNFMEYFIKSIVAFENPVVNPHGAAKNLLSLHASQKVKVVLSGEGSDELLGGYAYLRINKLKTFTQKHPHFAQNSLPLFLQREMGMSMNHLDGASSEFQTLLQSYFGGTAPSLFGRLTKRRFYRHLTQENIADKVEAFCQILSVKLKEETLGKPISSWDLDSWMALRTDLFHYILANVGDRQEMSHSLEGRTPFLDPKVASLASRIQEKHLIRGLTEKYVLRQVGKKYLNSEHVHRGKKPFFAPMKYLYVKENRALSKHYIQIAKQQTPWLNWRNIEHLLDNKKSSVTSPLEGAINSLRLIFFSLGVLSEHLREPKTLQPRGYSLPTSVAEILPYQRSFKNAL